MDETLLKLRILARAEMTLARANARRKGIKASLVIVALGLVLLTVILVNLAAYEHLSQTHSRDISAIILAAVNAVLAVIVLIVAGRQKPGPEEQMVEEIREMAMTELSADFEQVREGFSQVSDDVKKIKSGISTFTGAVGSAGSGLGGLAPVLSLLTHALKKGKG